MFLVCDTPAPLVKFALNLYQTSSKCYTILEGFSCTFFFLVVVWMLKSAICAELLNRFIRLLKTLTWDDYGDLTPALQ